MVLKVGKISDNKSAEAEWVVLAVAGESSK